MFSASELSKIIRAKKKMIKNAEPGIVDTSPVPDMNAQDVWDMEKKGQIEDTVDADPKINADETAMNEDYVQKPMSKEPMSSPMNPKDHGRMAYGGMIEPNPDPSMDEPMNARQTGGDSGIKSEMAQRFSNKPSVGVGEMGGDPDVSNTGDGEAARRIKMRKMRLSSYLDSLM